MRSGPRCHLNHRSPKLCLRALQNEYVARQKKSEAKQKELSEIIDVLGYIPQVPLDGDE
ncbi:transcriptional repressor TraM [Rhizobium sp. F40D2]|uniref:transcriptional repressor TraM n=1 Tax=Rhizobium sp. F40D2 TaxID=3453141 RepID=UPI003F21B68A